MSTLNKIFGFTSSAEGWTFDAPSGNFSVSWSSSVGNPAGSILVQLTSSGSGSGSAYWTGTWENLGVPAGSTVTQVQLSGLDSKITQVGGGSNLTLGPIDFRDPSNNSLLFNLAYQRQGNAVDSSPYNFTGSSNNVPSNLQASSSNIKLQIENTFNTTGASTAYYDNFNLLITYTTPPTTGTAALSKHPNLAGGGTVSVPVYLGSVQITKHPILSSNNPAELTHHPVLVAAGISSMPVYQGAVLLSKHPNLTVSGTSSVPVYQGAFQTSKHPNLVGVGNYSSGVSGAASLSKHPDLVAASTDVHSGSFAGQKQAVLQTSGSFTAPTYSGSSLLTSQHPLLNFAAFYGSGVLGSTGLSKSVSFSSANNTFTAPSGSTGSFVGGKSVLLSAQGLYADYISSGMVISRHPTLLASGLGPHNITSLNLFISGRTPPPLSVQGNIPLYTIGSLAPGTLPGTDPTALHNLTGLNLFISGADVTDSQSPLRQNLNLFIQASLPPLVGEIPLYLCNQFQAIENQLRLFIRGAGKNAGSYVATSNLNLFVSGVGSGPLASPLSLENNITLFIRGNVPGPSIGILNAIPLYLDVAAFNTISGNITLYVSGQPNFLVNSIPLVIPKISQINTIPLYVHGF